jgi:hypothetical protein
VPDGTPRVIIPGRSRSADRIEMKKAHYQIARGGGGCNPG